LFERLLRTSDVEASGGPVVNNGLGQVKATVGLFRQNANLLESEIKALSEIIKNSYDADATNVILNLKDAFKPKAQNPQIIIKDNGHGMSLDDFNNKWFIVGKSVNRDEPYSPKGRVRQGGKGLGRLGAWKIGERVTVYSSKRGHSPLGVCIDISDLSDGQLFSDITPVPVQGAESYFSQGEYGTIILIEKFNKQLTGSTNFCQNMARSILLLQNPFEGLTDFKINPLYPADVIADMAHFNLHELASQALYHADLEIEGNVIQGTFKNNNKYSEDYGKSEDFYKKLDEHSTSRLRSVSVKIRAFAGDSALYKYTRVLPGNNQALGKQRFEELTGFRLYKDGIRVAPYGEAGNNWLGLDDVSHSGDGIFQSKRLIAMANYSISLNPDLKEVAARNGLMNTKEYSALVDLLKLAVKQLRKWAGSIPNSLPKRLTPPELHFSRIDAKPQTEFKSTSPTNTGGKFGAFNASCVHIPDLSVDKNGVVSGTSPVQPGDYPITVSASNEHGSSDTILMLKVIHPPNQSSPSSHVQPPSSSFPQADEDETRPRISNASTMNTLTVHHRGLQSVMNDIEDPEAKQKLKEILDEIIELIDRFDR
jgi:hypothetical protein